jgi:phenylacetic acid degradation operon negative regulatory protein
MPSGSPSTPAAEQPREGGPSAPSLLLTVLGEFVHPRGGQVWTGTLVEALGALGVEPKAARQALARTAAEGLLTSDRQGRRVRWTLTEQGARLLEEGTQRIYGFMREPHGWDGQWLVLTVGVPESQRRLRHRMRTRLTWLGLGSPDASKEPAVREVVTGLGLGDRAFAWVGRTAQIGDPAKMIRAAWDVDDVEKRYLSFVDRFQETTAETDRDAFVRQVLLIQEWRRFPFSDPDLPAELLDHDWPGAVAAAVFHDRRNRWHRRAQAEWDRMDTDAGSRT